MIGRIVVIAEAAFREAVRSRIFLNLLALLALLLLGGVVVDAGAIGDTGRVFNNIAHTAISISGSMIALFVGVNLIAADLERKTLHLILARPVSRFEVVLGKYLGLAGVLAVNTLAALLVYSFTAIIAIGQWTTLSLAGVVSIAALYLQFLVVAAIAVMFSTLSSTTTATVFSLMLYVVGRLGDQMHLLAARAGASSFGTISAVFRVIIPDLTRFDLDPNAALPSASALGLMLLYTLLWSSALVTLGGFILSHRDLK